MLKIVLIVLLVQSSITQVHKIQYSKDANGVLKPNYCRKKACIQCVDKGQYFGCEKCIYYGTKNKEIHKCDDLTIRERESKFTLRAPFIFPNSSNLGLDLKKSPNQMGSDMSFCEGTIAQIPFKRNSPNNCTMCRAGMFLLYPRDPVKYKGTKAVACIKAPNTGMIDCLVGHAFPKELKPDKRVLYSDAQTESLSVGKSNQNDPNVVRNKSLTYRCYVCKGGHPTKDLLNCVKPRQYSNYFKKFNVKPFDQCSHGVRSSENVEGFCALCSQPVFSVVGDRLSQNFGQCRRI